MTWSTTAPGSKASASRRWVGPGTSRPRKLTRAHALVAATVSTMSPSGPSAAPIPLHVAGEPPAPPAPDVLGTSAGPGRQPAPAVRPGAVDWAALGVEPRWKDQETGDCAAVLSPVRGPATGLERYKRYAAGARQRGETALVVACTGAGERSHNVFSGTVAPGIHLPDRHGSISANPLPVGVSPELADGLDHAEHDLGTRLLNRPPGRSTTQRSFENSDGDVRPAVRASSLPPCSRALRSWGPSLRWGRRPLRVGRRRLHESVSRRRVFR